MSEQFTDDQIAKIAGESWDAIIDGAEEWAGQDEETIRIHTETTRAVLEAAAPYMLAQAWDEGRQADDFEVSIGMDANPYRTAH